LKWKTPVRNSFCESRESGVQGRNEGLEEEGTWRLGEEGSTSMTSQAREDVDARRETLGLYFMMKVSLKKPDSMLAFILVLEQKVRRIGRS
jgi:hypothetical protein